MAQETRGPSSVRVPTDTPHRAVRLSRVLSNREFRSLWLAEAFSIAGDQLARVALSIIVFNRTGSAALTGLMYALTFVPSFIGGAVFGGLGDRFRRRTVMVGADLGRAVLIGLAALPHLPLAALCALIALSTLLSGPFKAAQQALLPSVLPGENYASGMAVRNITSQAAQLIGFAGGGALVSILHPPLALAINAATFVLSALLLQGGLTARPVARPAVIGMRAQMCEGGTAVFSDPSLRTLAALCWLAGCYIAPEALAAPFAEGLGGGPAAVGAVMASDPFGSIIGGLAFVKWVPAYVRHKVIGLLGICAGLPLVACAWHPNLWLAMVLFALSGACATAYTIEAGTTFVRRLPDTCRAQGSGMLSSGMITAQGLGALTVGIVADVMPPASAIALAGGAGVGLAIPIARAWRRVRV